MKEYTIYKCDCCDFTSSDSEVTATHEASHFNLSLKEYRTWNGLKTFIRNITDQLKKEDNLNMGCVPLLECAKKCLASFELEHHLCNDTDSNTATKSETMLRHVISADNSCVKEEIWLSNLVASQMDISIGDCIIISHGIKSTVLKISKIVDGKVSYVNHIIAEALQIDFDGDVIIINKINDPNIFNFEKYLGLVF